MSLLRRLLYATCIAVCALSCAPTERADTSTSATTVTAVEDIPSVPRDGGTLVRRLSSDINTLNFVMHTTQYEKDVLSYIHAPLLEIDQELKIAPGIADSWTVSPDGKTFTFKLNPRATFSDGHAVTASDVVFTLRKIVDPKSEAVQLAGLFEGLNLKETRAIDPHTVEVKFYVARASQLLAFNIAVIPEHFYGQGNFKTGFARRALGAGPYVLREIKPGESIRLQRRARYWRDRPHIENILFRVVSDDNVAWNAMKRGDLDEMQMTSDQWKREKGDQQLQERIDFRRFYLLGYDFIAWNTRDELLSDKRVRQALAMCLDRRSIISNLFYGTARMMTGPFTPDQWAYNPEVKALEFDISAAKKLMKEAGWTDSNDDGMLDRGGKPFSFEVLIPAGNASSTAQAQVFQDGLKKAGIELKINAIDPAAMFERIFAGKYQATFLGWNLDLDPDLFSILHSSQIPPAGQNFVFYSNPEVDRLITAGRTEFDQEKRAEIYKQLHAILADEQPYTWTVQVSTKWAVSKRVQGVEESNGLGLFSWYPGPFQWWLASDAGAAPVATR